MSRKGTNLSFVRVLMAHPVAIRDGLRAISNHYSLVNPECPFWFLYYHILCNNVTLCAQL